MKYSPEREALSCLLEPKHRQCRFLPNGLTAVVDTKDVECLPQRTETPILKSQSKQSPGLYLLCHRPSPKS
jgi:hypothetical protein